MFPYFSIKRRITLMLSWHILCSSVFYLEASAGLPHPKADLIGGSKVTSSPQTTTESASLETFFSSFSGLAANTVVTRTIQGTPTIVPVWFCGPSETAAACKSCPSMTGPLPSSITSKPPACTSGFNGIFIVPIIPLPVPAGLPPPEGLPTLTVGEDGTVSTQDEQGPQKTPQPPSKTPKLPTTLKETSTKATSSSSSSTSIILSCPTASIKARDAAAEVSTEPPPAHHPVPTTLNDGPPTPTKGLPILPIKNKDPEHPTAMMDCGPNANDPYYRGGFYQFGSSFSRDDGLDAIGRFCHEQIKKKRVVGKAGIHPKKDPSLTAVPLVVRTYKVPGGSGDIMIRMQADVENKNARIQCPGEFDLYSFTANSESSVYAQCRQFLGQTIDYCDIDGDKSSSDTSWKNGGTFFTNCFYFTVVLSPAGGQPDIPK